MKFDVFTNAHADGNFETRANPIPSHGIEFDVDIVGLDRYRFRFKLTTRNLSSEGSTDFIGAWLFTADSATMLNRELLSDFYAALIDQSIRFVNPNGHVNLPFTTLREFIVRSIYWNKN